MNTHRFTSLLFAGVAACACAQAQEVRLTDKVMLICPDRSPRMSDIDLAVKAGHWNASEAVKRQMFERTRSVCAAGLSAVTLLAPARSQIAPENALAAQPLSDR